MYYNTMPMTSFCRHKVVIVEGNYLLLEEGVWKDISTIFDEKWYCGKAVLFCC